MAELKLLSLSESLVPDQIEKLRVQLHKLGVDFSDNDDSIDLDDALTEDQLTDFMDRLEAHDIACDVYLPAEFEGRLTIGEQTYGSAHALSEALEELREELDIDNEDSGEDDEELELEVIEEQLTYAWRVFARATNACLDRRVPLHVIP